MKFMDLAQARFSVREYSGRPVEKEILDQILEAGRMAPTAKNQQPYKIYVVQSEKALKKLSMLKHCAYGAKTVLLFTYNREQDWKNPLEDGIHSGVEDVSIVATYIMLQAIELGIYTTWCNYFSNSELEKAFQLPENEKSVLIMPIGYKADGTEPAPAHTASKESGELVCYL
jgi:nitroreductase